MDIGEFLEARISEQEADVLGGAPPASLTEALAAECAEKRAILAAWKEAAEVEGIADPADAEGAVSRARRSMLTILAAGYQDHPDYQEEWDRRLTGASTRRVRRPPTHELRTAPHSSNSLA